MEKKVVSKREKVMAILLGISVLLVVLAVYLFSTYRDSNKKEYIAYAEKYNVNYSVKLKENEHFGETQGKGEVYVSKLVDDITTNLSYQLEYGDVDVEISYTYKVYVLMEISLKDHSKPIYSTNYPIKDVSTPVVAKSVVIFNEIVSVDYDTYSSNATAFISAYGLSNATTKLTVVMEVKSTALHEDFVKNSTLNTNVKVNIPVNDSTFEISIAENSSRDNKVLLKSTTAEHLKVSALMYALLAVLIFVIRILYRNRTRNAKEIFEDKLDDILGNYESYIQKINGELNLSKYELIEIGEFEDLLEIKEALNKPVLMIEKEDVVDFVILDKNNLSYVYKLRVEESVK